MKCSECKWYLGTVHNDEYVVCGATDEHELIETCVAEDCDLECDLYVKNMDDY